MKKISFAIFLVIFFIAIPILFKVYAARLTPIEDIMSNNIVSQTSDNNIIFTASSGIPTDGSVTITFPSSFSSISATSATSNLSGSTFSVSGNTVTMSTTTSAENSGFQVNINGIYAINPSSASTDTNQYIIDVSDSSGDTAGIGVVISNTINTTYPGSDIYSQTITINNSSNTNTLTNYPVEVTMNTQNLISAGEMENTCGDIRITDSSGNELSYWVNNCNTTNTEIWIKIPSIQASSNTNIYLYYGNLSLTSLSSGSSVFPYFDQGNNIANWTTSRTAGQSTTTGDPAPSYYADGSTGDYMYINANVSENEVITFNVNTSALGDFFFLTNSAGAGQMFRLDGRGGLPSGFGTTSSWTSPSGPSSTAYLESNTWYKFSIVMVGSQASLYYNTTTGDNPNNFGTLIGTYTVADNGGYIGLIGDSGGGVTYWDNIIARPYSNPEPTTTLSSYVVNSIPNVQLSVNVQPYITFGVSSNNINLGLISYQSPIEQSNSLSLTTNSQNGANISVEDEYGGLLLLPFPGSDIYSQTITINNSSNTNTLTNYPVEVTMNTQNLISAGEMENTCGDIRITDSSGNELSYWVNNCNTTNTEIWIKIPSIQASSNTNIYLYYGNSNLTSLSSGSSVFPYFDQGNNIANWTISGTAGQSTTTGDPAPSYYADGSTGDYMYINANVSENEVITFNVNTSALGDFFFLTNSAGAGQMFRLDGRGGTLSSGFATTSSWTSFSGPSSTAYLESNTWYKFSIVMVGSQASLYYNTTTGDNPNNFGTLIGTYTVADNGGYIGLVGDGGGGVTYWDNIIARPYSNPEPTTTLSSYVVNSNQYVIKSSTGTITSGDQNYGINATGTNINILSPFNSSGFSVGGLLNTQTQILAQTNLPEQNATLAVNYIASASVTTPAGEYIDNVTYIATGNF